MINNKEVNRLCYELAEAVIKNGIKWREATRYFGHCLIAEASGRTDTKREACGLLGVSRRILNYYGVNFK